MRLRMMATRVRQSLVKRTSRVAPSPKARPNGGLSKP